jgi:hypothetical protein
MRRREVQRGPVTGQVSRCELAGKCHAGDAGDALSKASISYAQERSTEFGDDQLAG